jgi:hypothetical protein
MKRPDYILGIDPDVLATGLTVLCTETKSIDMYVLPLPDLIDSLKRWKQRYDDSSKTAVVVVEASWVNSTHNWHTSIRDSRATAAKKGYYVGCNHQIGKDIIEIAKHIGFEVVEQPPLRKGWNGKEGKITHEELAYFTGIKVKRSNQEMRDSCLLAWNYANFPIKVKNF